MFNLLEKLRKKSEGAKKRVAFIGALTLSGLVFVVWLSVIYPDFRRSQSKEAEVAKLQPGPLSSFTDTFSSGIRSIGDKFSEIKTAVSSMTSNATYYNATTTNYIITDEGVVTPIHRESVSTSTEQ